MKLKKGDLVPDVKLNDINNQSFQLSSLKGKKILLTFYRFASCPFCNLRLHQIATRYNEFDGIVHVAIFSASVSQLNRHTSKHRDLFPILADEEEQYYKEIDVESSWIGMFRGMIFKLHLATKSMFMGNIPTEIGRKMLRMPVNIIVDEEGVVEKVHYGKDEGDHIPIDEVLTYVSL